VNSKIHPGTILPPYQLNAALVFFVRLVRELTSDLEIDIWQFLMPAIMSSIQTKLFFHAIELVENSDIFPGSPVS